MFLKIISILGSLTFLSRILGYLRDLLIAKIIGAGLVSDAFFISFKLPNLFRRLFGEGAMNSAFIPVISGIKSKFGKNKSDTGSTEVQIALLTERINSLTSHLRNQPKDFSSRRCWFFR